MKINLLPLGHEDATYTLTLQFTVHSTWQDHGSDYCQPLKHLLKFLYFQLSQHVLRNSQFHVGAGKKVT